MTLTTTSGVLDTHRLALAMINHCTYIDYYNLIHSKYMTENPTFKNWGDLR